MNRHLKSPTSSAGSPARRRAASGWSLETWPKVPFRVWIRWVFPYSRTFGILAAALAVALLVWIGIRCGAFDDRYTPAGGRGPAGPHH